ncbi:hypothetical protein [Paraferrimonas sp. SM1919]|uniref:hypothetical protein n=1 Tax=Paraferrimonas sp. SM1919 TaxID=2662263 RepID=UPI0013D5890C|nr:hypothetical protein [Paraferrimonas sp. SM1919]
MLTQTQPELLNRQLAEIAIEHFKQLNIMVELGPNQRQLVGQLGNIVLCPSLSPNPNDNLTLPENYNQSEWVLFAWNTMNKRVFFMMVETSKIIPKSSLTRHEITLLRDQKLSKVMALN